MEILTSILYFPISFIAPHVIVIDLVLQAIGL